ncbi:MAG: hypothetical protein ACE5IK_14295 [Acidobacteriota bacterium]
MRPSARRGRELLQRVAEHAHQVFREQAATQGYLRSRGLTDPAMWWASTAVM